VTGKTARGKFPLIVLITLVGCAKVAPREPIPNLLPELDAIEVRLLNGAALVREWKELAARRQSAEPLACETLNASLHRSARKMERLGGSLGIGFEGDHPS